MKRLILLIIAAYVLQACDSGEGYTITGEVADANGLKVVLMRVTPDLGPVEVNSAVVRNGKFKMTGKVDFPEYSLLSVGDNSPLQFFVENAEIHIIIDLENLQEARISGSAENDLLMQFYGITTLFEEKANEINESYMLMMISGEMDEDEIQDLVAQMEALSVERIDFLRLFTAENSNSVFVAMIVDQILSPHLQYDELERFVEAFDEVNSQSPWVQMLKDKIENSKRFAVGQPYIDLQLPTPDGELLSISDVAGKGAYLLLDFWAAWCQPCRMKNPQLVKLYSTYKDKGFEILGISLDADREQWVQAIEDDELTWNHISDLSFWQSEAAIAYSVTTIPFNILLDKEGNIIAQRLSVNELEEKLAELIGE